MDTQVDDKAEDYDTLAYTGNSVKKQDQPLPKPTKPYNIYFDFETRVRYHDTGTTHMPYLM